ncbi:MAG: hypoxanthine phosphoribosyltransferase [Syntrophomonadaceae bacterium]|nr:hypoxanthine phosphoribosyltransferase [Syntrophomonadaceae bacterium]
MTETLEVLLSEEQIRERVKELAAQINRDFAGAEVLVVGILKGSFVFLADLVRYLDIPVKVDFMDVSSYGMTTESSGEVRILKDLEQPIERKNVIVVEDIIDSGTTLKFILGVLQRRRPRSLKVCTFLDKPSRRRVLVIPDYNGFSIPDHFVVGYGLDYAEQYRNLPDICIINTEQDSE